MGLAGTYQPGACEVLRRIIYTCRSPALLSTLTCLSLFILGEQQTLLHLLSRVFICW